MGVVRRVLVINVGSIKTIILNYLDHRLHKIGSKSRIDDDRVERRRIGPATDRKQHFEVPVLFLQIVDGLEVAVEVRTSGVIPRVVRIVYILVGPEVRENNFARFWIDVGECV